MVTIPEFCFDSFVNYKCEQLNQWLSKLCQQSQIEISEERAMPLGE